MAQTTIQGSFLGDATVTGAKIGADFISAQDALTTGLATADELIVSDGGVIKKMAISVLEIAATQITANGTLPVLNGSALTDLDAADLSTGAVPVLRLGSSGSRSSSTFLNGVNAWATPVGAANQNAWTTFTRSASGGTAAGADVVAVSETDSIDFIAGANITITGDNTNKTLTIAAAAGGTTYTTGSTNVHVVNDATTGVTLNNNYKFTMVMPSSGEGLFFKCADQGSEQSALYYADYPSQITKIAGSSKWSVLDGGQTGSSGDGKFYVVSDANSRTITVFNREGNNRTITVHGMGRLASVTAQASI